MDELKLLVEMVSSLPTFAVWIVAGFLAYKVVVVGSIYGLIRLGLTLLHNWLVSPRRTEFSLGDSTINAAVAAALLAQVQRMPRSTNYLHMSDVHDLAEAIDAVIARRAEKKKP